MILYGETNSYPQKGKARIYNTVVHLVLTYAAETRVDTIQDQKYIANYRNKDHMINNGYNTAEP